MFNGLFPEGEVTNTDKALSVLLAGSFIPFAHTGDPIVSGDSAFGTWPEAFPEATGLCDTEVVGSSELNV